MLEYQTWIDRIGEKHICGRLCGYNHCWLRKIYVDRKKRAQEADSEQETIDSIRKYQGNQNILFY